MRRKRVGGFGPLKRERWEEESFEVRMELGTESAPTPELKLRCFEHANGIALQGTLRNQQCYFADLAPATGKKRATFVMVSVTNVELRGRVEVVD